MKKLFSLFVAAFVAMSMMAQGYCDFATGHFGDANFADPNARILLSLEPTANANEYKMTIKPNVENGNTSKLDYLYVIGGGNSPYPATAGTDDNGDALDEMSVVFTNTNTTASFTIQWSTPNWGGRWQLDLQNVDLTALTPCANEGGDEEPEVTYSLKHPWGSGADEAWSWKELTKDGSVYTITDFYGGTGCNWKSSEEGATEEWVANPTLVGEPAVGDECVFTLDPTTASITIEKIVIPSSPYCQKEIGHFAAENADPNSFVLLSIGSDGEGHTIVRIDQDAAKNSAMFDYLQVTGCASTGADNNDLGVESLGVSFNTPAADADGNITLEILWSTVGWPGRWMVQEVKVPADATCASATVANMPKVVYYLNTSAWENVYCHAWNGVGDVTAPDVVMTATGRLINGTPVYVCGVDTKYEKCLFNDGNTANNTNDQTILEARYYTRTASWSAAEVETIMANIYLMGSVNGADGWSPKEAFFFNEGEKSFTVGGGDYEVKVLRYGEWYGIDRTINATTNDMQFSIAEGKNLQIGISALSDLAFVWNDEAKQLSVEIAPADLLDMTYTIVGQMELMGANWEVNATANDMTFDGASLFTLEKQELNLAAGSYEYKAVGNHRWDLYEYPAGEGNNNMLVIEANGMYNVTFTLDPVNLQLTAAAVRTGWATGCDEAEAQKAQKIVRDGKIVILKNGAEYSVLGQKL